MKDLANSEKPRERLLERGEKYLSNAELIAILLNTGRKGSSSLDIANELLNKVTNLKHLQQLSIYDLKEIKGIGLYKAIILKATFELGIRIHSGSIESQVKFKKPADVANYLMAQMQHLSQEHFVALFLNSKNIIIKQKTIFKGTLNSSIIHPREIFCEAIKWSSHAIIVAHNHPSGDVTPSAEDIKTTERLIECGDILGIGLLDHIIIGHNNYLSLVESGYIE